ncbi:MAG: O-acetylhomoserine aminocarboxypropyltransferase/cysteine synthase [Clostridiales bacterium]|nr:O-acetylhomoserine aminocarboxypropyltransferase/cysteine synthase [Clostridiales bacterium]
MDSNYKFDTLCVQAGYKADKGAPQVMPIVQNTTYRYYEAEDVAKLFDLESGDYMYSRLGNPTVSTLEKHMAALEGGTAAVAASSGQAATLMTILTLAEKGDHIISSSQVYGGTYNLFAVTLKKLGIDFSFIDTTSKAEDIVKMATPNTKAIFAETLANPALKVLNFKEFKEAANKLGVPLIIDNTLATPYLTKPILHGADIVLHSTTKFSDGHGTSVGGIVIEAGNFDWGKSHKFLSLTTPDESYHGLNFYEKFGDTAFSTKLRATMLRDLGGAMSPMNAFLTHQGLKTLHLRMERHTENALKLAEFLNNHNKVDWVIYPGLKTDPSYNLASMYMPKGAGGVLSFGVHGGREKGEILLRNLNLSSLVVHVGDIKTSVLHPASTTHRQMTEEEQVKAGISPELIRVSVGIEDIEDIIEDFDKALSSL